MSDMKPNFHKLFDSNGRFFGWCSNIRELDRKFIDGKLNMTINPFASRYVDTSNMEWQSQSLLACPPLSI